jgi:hypothetical protein
MAMARFGKNLDGSKAKSWRKDMPTPHLRRTVSTCLAKLEINKEIRERVLNHTSSDPESRHYNVYQFESEKRRALNRWAEEVNALIAEQS